MTSSISIFIPVSDHGNNVTTTVNTHLGSRCNDTSYKVSLSRKWNLVRASCSGGTCSKLYGLSYPANKITALNDEILLTWQRMRSLILLWISRHLLKLINPLARKLGLPLSRKVRSDINNPGSHDNTINQLLVTTATHPNKVYKKQETCEMLSLDLLVTVWSCYPVEPCPVVHPVSWAHYAPT